MERRTFLYVTGAAAASCAWGAEGKPGPTVETIYGKVRGLQLDKVQAFKGLRYGADTSGANRFLAPKKPAKWTGVQDAFEWGQEAPQSHPHTEIPEVSATVQDHTVGEDCLR